MRRLRILGTRGVPAAHGGFETFAERLAPFLVSRGWQVSVYCQEQGQGPVSYDQWQGVERVRIPVRSAGALGSVVFDWKATRHAARSPGLCLTLGYNTAVFCALLKQAGIANVMNMDGIEWRRAKWGLVAKTWFWLNEHAGSRLATHLVADHPEIARHHERTVRADKITTIAYGADPLQGLPEDAVVALGLAPRRYVTLIARPEPENSVLEIVRAFSARPRGRQLAVLGAYQADNAFHQAVRQAAGPEVRFLGAIYAPQIVQALRLHALAHIHGHRVGGTNPSLVEALGAGNAIVAHDNRFNRWVIGDGGRYFGTTEELDDLLTRLLPDTDALLSMATASLERWRGAFTWPLILSAYEALLERFAQAQGQRSDAYLR